MNKRMGFSAVVVLAGIFALGGCSANVEKEPATPVESSPADNTQSASVEPTNKPSSEDADDEETSGASTEGTPVDLDDLPENFAAMSEAYSSIAVPLSCKDGSADVASTGSIVKLDSDCQNVTVSGNGVVVLGGTLSTVNVTGTGSVIAIESVSTVDISGTGNVVVWESGSPTVNDSGIGNTTN